MAADAGASGGPRIIECSFLVPIRRNSNRRRHRPMMWALLTNALRRTFGGFSGPRRIFAFRGIDTVAGEWTDSRTGRTVKDQSRQFVVALPEEKLDDLRALLRKAAHSFDQEEIYLSVRGEVEFVKPGPKDGFLD